MVVVSGCVEGARAGSEVGGNGGVEHGCASWYGCMAHTVTVMSMRDYALCVGVGVNARIGIRYAHLRIVKAITHRRGLCMDTSK